MKIIIRFDIIDWPKLQKAIDMVVESGGGTVIMELSNKSNKQGYIPGPEGLINTGGVTAYHSEGRNYCRETGHSDIPGHD